MRKWYVFNLQLISASRHWIATVVTLQKEKPPDIKYFLLKEQNITSGFAKKKELEWEISSVSNCLFAEHTEDTEMCSTALLVCNQLNLPISSDRMSFVLQ